MTFWHLKREDTSLSSPSQMLENDKTHQRLSLPPEYYVYGKVSKARERERRGRRKYISCLNDMKRNHTFKNSAVISDSWPQFSGNTSISHISLKHVETHIGDTKIQFQHLQFPIFKVLFSFIINLEKTLWCVKAIFSFFFLNSSLLFYLVSPLARMLIFICL